MGTKSKVRRLVAGLGLVVAIAGAGAGLGGCAYGGVASTPDGTVVIVRNDFFLFGLLRKVYVCRATPGGLQCQESPAAP